MPGVAEVKPEIAAVVQRHQHYQPLHEPLRELNQLTREHKHNPFRLRIIRETTKCRVTEKATGAYVEWYGFQFEPGNYFSQGFATIHVQPEPDRDPSLKPMEFDGSTLLRVFGVPFDFTTQEPTPDERIEVRTSPYERWWFIEPHVPILDALSLFNEVVTTIVQDVLHVAFP